MPRTKTTSIDMRKSSSKEGNTESKKRQASEMNQSELPSSPMPEDTAGPSNRQPPVNETANMPTRPRRMRLLPVRTYPNRYQVLSEQLDKSNSSSSIESLSSGSGSDQAPDLTLRARRTTSGGRKLERVATSKRSARSKLTAKQLKETKYVRVSLDSLCAYCRNSVSLALTRPELASSSDSESVTTPSSDEGSSSEADRPKRVQPKRAKRTMQ